MLDGARRYVSALCIASGVPCLAPAFWWEEACVAPPLKCCRFLPTFFQTFEAMTSLEKVTRRRLCKLFCGAYGTVEKMAVSVTPGPLPRAGERSRTAFSFGIGPPRGQIANMSMS